MLVWEEVGVPGGLVVGVEGGDNGRLLVGEFDNHGGRDVEWVGRGG